MLLSWIKKTTLLDYPWKVSTIVFTLWCNFRCHYCHNYEFVLPENTKEFLNDLIPEVAFFNFLQSRKWLLDWVVISWWEPTLQRDLYEFIKKIKDMWFLVKLDTNGRDPNILKKLIDENLLDYIAMDIKYSFSKYNIITWVEEDIFKIIRSKDIIMNSWVDYEFRTTVSKWYFTEDVIRGIWEDIKWASKWYLQNLVEKNLLNPWFNWTSFESRELEGLRQIWEEYVNECKVR